jgi:4-amino-4-deoxychorismate lyase
MNKYLVNGTDTERVNVADRGLQYGDGLFETLRMSAGCLEFADRHWRRLQTGCERLGIAFPGQTIIENDIIKLVEQQQDAVIKVIITRGQGGRGYRPTPDLQPTRIVSMHPVPLQPATEGVAVRLSQTRLSINPRLAGIKHLNRLEQVLARQEWSDPGVYESLMFDTAGRLVCGTMSNVFFRAGDRYLTPSVEQCGIAGVTRSVILDILESRNMPVQVDTIKIDDIEQVDEMFLCNSVFGIIPVRELERGNPQPGQWTGDAIDLFAETRRHKENHLCVE